MKRVYNFAAGPAALPLSVLEKAKEELTDLGGTGMSVMEMSHRSSTFKAIANDAETRLRRLLSIPENYKVLFLQGGASMQFDMLPMNLMHNTKRAYYINSGSFAKKAAKEAKLFGEVIVPASSEEANYTYLPKLTPDMFAQPADYVHITYNNTIYGTEFHGTPDVNGQVLVADMTSCILSEPINVADYGVIYAGAQKNVGPAGVVIAIIRKDLIREDVLEYTPTMLRWSTHEKNGSMYNTPPCYGIYMCGKVFKWIKAQGGLEGMEKRNKAKAQLLYDFLDNSKLFKSTVEPKDRSIMNVPFVTGDEELDKLFIAQATEAGLVELKGHRSVGGMRASIYNAMPIEGVQKLVDFMAEFERAHA